jgi:hypothetical protein
MAPRGGGGLVSGLFSNGRGAKGTINQNGGRKYFSIWGFFLKKKKSRH